MADLMTIVALTVGSCLLVGLLGFAALRLGRLRPLRYQFTLAALMPVVAVVVALVINVQLMFLSGHDTLVILIALVTSAVLAVLGAWLVARRIVTASTELGAGLTQLVVEGGGGTTAPAERSTRTAPQELARVLDDLEQTRQTLAESRARERAAEQSRRELVSFMSHDLRTPLAGLRALAEGLEDGVIADVPRAMSHLRNTVARMAVLVDDLFALSRVQQPTQEPKPLMLVSLTELISDVASETAPTARVQGVTLEVTVPEDDRLAVLGSADDLARALANLATNAIRHTDPGRVVLLEGSRADDGHITVAVVDGCGGIPESHLARVFDTGWRGSSARGDDGGAGLGLAITRGVVESHDGAITVCNVAGGCRFEVALPASQPPRG